MAVDFSSALVEALSYLWEFDIDMGDSIEEVVESITQAANIPYDPYAEWDEDGYMDPEDAIEIGMEVLVDNHSSYITDCLYYLFTEANLVESIFEELEGSYSQRMLEALEVVYRQISGFPRGEEIKGLLEENILIPAGIDFEG